MSQVAIKHYICVPKTVKLPNGKVYHFVPQNNISLAFVDKDDEEVVMNIKKTCCGGHKKRIFRWASETDVRRWKHGGR